MAAMDVLGTVCDRLVEGMMFHSDRADLCRFMGFERLVKLHEDGFADDSGSFRKVRRLCVERLDTFPSQGRQERGRSLDKWKGRQRSSVTTEERHDALVEVMADWVEWEDGTADTFRTAARRLWDMGETALAKKVNGLADSTESELAEAKFLHNRLVASDWDATIA